VLSEVLAHHRDGQQLAELHVQYIAALHTTRSQPNSEKQRKQHSDRDRAEPHLPARVRSHSSLAVSHSAGTCFQIVCC
jgi:hypothetical protein